MTEQQTEQQNQPATDEQRPAQADGSSWGDLFPDLDPVKVKEALDQSRKWETRAKENFDKASKYDQFVESQKTEQQRLEERATAAERQAQEATTEALRLQVALTKGLSPSQAKRLVGTTAEELESDADEMLADLQPTRPRGDVGQGPRGQDSAEPDMNSLIRSALGRR